MFHPKPGKYGERLGATVSINLSPGSPNRNKGREDAALHPN
jgi:hypothetical protein